MGVYEVKTHLSELVDRAERGETIRITRHGAPVAQLGPITPSREERAQRAVEEIRRLSKEWHLDGLSLIDLKNEGRR